MTSDLTISTKDPGTESNELLHDHSSGIIEKITEHSPDVAVIGLDGVAFISHAQSDFTVTWLPDLLLSDEPLYERFSYIVPSDNRKVLNSVVDIAVLDKMRLVERLRRAFGATDDD